MAKCVYTPDERVFVIGGARDNKTQQTISDVTEYGVMPNGQVTYKTRAPMRDTRASFGCVLSPVRQEVFVAGGYINGEVSKKCERYSLVNDHWVPIASLNEEKSSNTLCILDNKSLYSFGGMSKITNNI